MQDFDRAYGLKSICLRYFNAAGANDTPDGTCIRDHVHVSDCFWPDSPVRWAALPNRLGSALHRSNTSPKHQTGATSHIDVHEVHPSVQVSRDGAGIEIDLLVVNDGSLVAVECKSKLTEAHVDEESLSLTRD